MDFCSYPKIEEDLKSLQLSEEEYRKLNKITWVVTEKIHGANFSVITDGNFLRYAKRKELLNEDDDFFDYKSAVQDKELKFWEAFEFVKSTHPDVIEISFFGELFGGSYPHPELEARDFTPVQSGIYYSPVIEFFIFDILLRTEKENYFLSYNELSEVCKQFNLPYTEALMIGKFSDALNFPFEFESKVPSSLKLPPLPFPNKAEGIVIKPSEHILVESSKGKIRPVIKRKIKEFAEDFYTQSSQDVTQLGLKQRVLALVNQNRIDSAISKSGRIKKGDEKAVEKICSLVLEDIEFELASIEKQQQIKITGKEKELLMGEIRGLVMKMVR